LYYGGAWFESTPGHRLTHLQFSTPLPDSCAYCCHLMCICCTMCVHCCFYFICRTAGYKSVFGRSCERSPRHRFFLVSLCL